MPISEGYIPGDRWVTCDICGFICRRSKARLGISRQQKGLTVCEADFDPQHPLDDIPKRRKEEGPIKVR